MGGGAGLHRGGPVGAGQGLNGPDRLFYDGGCGLCHRAVSFLAGRDRAGAIRFAPLGGATFLRSLPLEARGSLPDSLVVLTAEGGLLTRSAAVRHLLRRIGGGWGLLARAAGLLPLAWADGLYDAVARRRGRWFPPPVEGCPLPPGDQRARFEP